MRAWRDGSSDARAARAATVLPVPASPVITPRAASATPGRGGGEALPEMADPGRARGRGGGRWRRSRDVAGDPPRGAPADLVAVVPDLDREQVLGPIAELDPPPRAACVPLV